LSKDVHTIGPSEAVPSTGLRPELATALRREPWFSPPLLPGWLDDEAEQKQQMPPEAERKAQPLDSIRDRR
jgi:hypothetical protein